MKNSKFKIQNSKLVIGWLYPELMSTYGDRGNVICLTKRCEWRGFETEIVRIGLNCKESLVESCDLILGGGSQDRQQGLAVKDLLKMKKIFRELFGRGIPGLFVCGSPQLLGHYYMTGDGTKLEGLGIFDYVTEHPGYGKSRCIGNTAGLVVGCKLSVIGNRNTIVGFENHGGRTYLGSEAKPFARVIKGNGNNGEDGFEGAVYLNVIACYYHGPFLPKNPHIADWLIKTALEVKYKKEIKLDSLDDSLEWQAHEFMLKKMGIK